MVRAHKMNNTDKFKDYEDDEDQVNEIRYAKTEKLKDVKKTWIKKRT